jgi:protein-glutamine gamma-glutamyltransferase
MIHVAGVEMKYDELKQKYPEGGMERKILEILASSDNVLRYTSAEEMSFELEMRRRIIDASVALYRSGLRFRIFRESECNENYWERMENGGFRLKSGVKPSAGLRDIYENTRKYATECATAIVIVFYKAVLDIYKDPLFDRTFPRIVLMNWLYTDNKLGVYTNRNPQVHLPGDCRYFKNPDVDPLTPEWQGENAIDLGDGTYYGHGLGIRSAEAIIRILNRRRVPGSEISAYLMDSATLPDFEALFRVYGAAAPATIASEQRRPHGRRPRRPS